VSANLELFALSIGINNLILTYFLKKGPILLEFKAWFTLFNEPLVIRNKYTKRYKRTWLFCRTYLSSSGQYQVLLSTHDGLVQSVRSAYPDLSVSRCLALPRKYRDNIQHTSTDSIKHISTHAMTIYPRTSVNEYRISCGNSEAKLDFQDRGSDVENFDLNFEGGSATKAHDLSWDQLRLVLLAKWVP